MNSEIAPCDNALTACNRARKACKLVNICNNIQGKQQQAMFVLILQGFLFAFVGMCAGLTGTAISNTLLLLRQKLDADFKSQNEAPNVPLNAATWAAHMGISSNVRYQVLNGLDMVSHFCLTPHNESGLPAYSQFKQQCMVHCLECWHCQQWFSSRVCVFACTPRHCSLFVPVSFVQVFVRGKAKSACS